MLPLGWKPFPNHLASAKNYTEDQMTRPTLHIGLQAKVLKSNK